MKHLLFLSMLLFFACNNKQATTAVSIQDTILPPLVIILADLPDSLQPRTIALNTRPKPKKHIISQYNKPIDANGGLANFTTFTTDDGLPLDAVNCSIVDKNGNLWFGTLGGGASRYDGKSFINFSTKQGLPNNNIQTIAEDSRGNLWFGTQGAGVSRFDGKSFVTFSTDQGLPSNTIWSICEDDKGNLWFGTYGGGVSRYDGNSFVTYSKADGLASNNIYCSHKDRKGNLWFGTYGGGVSRYDGKSFVNFSKDDGLASNNVWSICEDKKGNLWFGTYGGGVSYYDPKKALDTASNPFINFTTAQGLTNNMIWSICEDKKGKVWFATHGGGVNCFNGKDFVSFSTDQGLANNKVFSISEDKNGNLWFGTEGGGISRYNSESVISFSPKQGLADKIVWSIIEDSMNNLWFGTYGGGASRYDGKSFVNFSTDQGLPVNVIFSIYRDKKGNIWFGTHGGGVSRYDGKSFVNFSSDHGLANNTVRSIVEDKKGNIWFGTDGGGVSCYNGESFINFSTGQGLANGTVFSICEDRSGNLWFGTEAGVSRYDGKSFINYFTDQGLSSNVVRDIHEDTKGNIWFGTEAGLCVIGAKDVEQLNVITHIPGRREKLFKTFTTTDGLPNDFVTQVMQMPNDRIAIGTNTGITFFMPSEDLINLNEIEIFNTNTAYPIKDINVGQNCMYLDSKGVLWAGTGNAKNPLVRFDYSAVDKDSLPPFLVITGIKINEETISWNSLLSQKLGGDITSGKTKALKEDNCNIIPAYITEEVTSFGRLLTPAARGAMLQKFRKIDFDSISPFYYLPQDLALPYKYNHIAFDFNAVETGRPFMVNYQYMLEGYENKWSPVSKNVKAVYGNIFEGTYTFKVKAQSPAGVWCKPITYTFKVFPPWYRTWWMYIAYGFLLIATLQAVIKWRERNLRADKERLEKTVKERTAEIVQEKKKSDILLLNILPEVVANELKETGTTTAQQFDNVTVIFTDFVAFTRAGERMVSTALVAELHSCFKAFDEIIGKYGIEKIKTIGDAYLAVCGLPTPDAQHAEKVVKASQEIKAFMLKRREQLGDKTFEIRIGMHSGSVVAGVVGVMKFAYDIWGDTVNTAARLEQNSEPGKINVSQTTYELIKGKYTCIYRGEIEAKNKGMMKMYFVEGALA